MAQNKNRGKTAARGRRGDGRQPAPLVMALGGALLLAAMVWAALAVWRNASAPATPAEVSGAPALRVDREVVDLGDVPMGQPVEVAFTVRNAGDRMLRLEAAPYIEVVAGC